LSDLHLMYYSTTGAVAIRQRKAPKRQILQLHASGVPREILESYAKEVIGRLTAGTSTIEQERVSFLAKKKSIFIEVNREAWGCAKTGEGQFRTEWVPGSLPI
jgi:hypothetical protein